MPGFSSMFGGGLPIGSTILAPYSLTDPSWLPCDGSTILRATYPILGAVLPSIGTFTPTIRTKSAAPVSQAIATDGTVWVVTGSTSQNIYTTTDGITYTARTVPTGTDIRSIIYDGTNFVAAGNDATNHSMYSTTGGTTWSSSSTGGAYPEPNSNPTCMAWASTLGTVGRFCIAGGGSNTGSVWTSDNRGVSWTSRTVLGSPNIYHVCWTGSTFLATGSDGHIHASTDGITWTGFDIPGTSVVATIDSWPIISNGAGKVLTSYGSSVITSLDNGATWKISTLYNLAGTALSFANCQPSYTNNRFFIATSSSQLCSTDLISWLIQPVLNAGAYWVNSYWSYKSGVYLVNVSAASLTALTVVEDTGYALLPNTGNSSVAGISNFKSFIKAK